jgi:SpoVK/Ycf46/Vps4 family AAA+-type ATPase
MVILPDAIKDSLQDIVNFGKAQSILFGQWGFSSQHGGSKGIGVLFCGPPGTGNITTSVFHRLHKKIF